ncbi:MAG: hypothetical protein O7C67_04375 [Gammaproteobacteria bacterium]|nr:hypothetical protein [Gammaproteobacteria bacterium]
MRNSTRASFATRSGGTMAQGKSRYFTIVILLLLSLLGSCASSGGAWGANATIFPVWARVKTAATDAAKDPKTWVPLVSAALFAIDDFDQQTVDWATRNNPLFGNVENAKDASDLLRDIASANWLLTALRVPSGEGATDARNRAKGIGLSLAAFALKKIAQPCIGFTAVIPGFICRVP